MNISYWEYKTWLSNIDFTIVGSGIVGLNCAMRLAERFRDARIVVLEKGILPQGASTKNAGFACFGSISEVLGDLETHTEEEVQKLVRKRWDGMQTLRKILGDDRIGFQNFGGHELFPREYPDVYEKCVSNLDRVNTLLNPIYKADAFTRQPNSFRFNNIRDTYISNRFEGQIDTGQMMASLMQKVHSRGILVLNAITVDEFYETPDGVAIRTDRLEFVSGKLLVATNGFASQLLDRKVKPARAQVLITKPIPNLHIKGTFHLEEGYYYFRDVDNRILLGGGRNLDFKAEETTEFGHTKKVMDKLESLLQEVILPGITFQIDRYWSGIMGVGPEKSPIVQQVSDHVYCGVRLGGMGIAIGSLVGRELADLIPD